MNESEQTNPELFRRSLIRGDYDGFNIRHWLYDNLKKLLPEDGLEDVNWAGLPYGAENPILLDIEEIIAFDVPRAERVSDDVIRFSCDFAMIGEFQCDILLDSWEGVVPEHQLVQAFDVDPDENYFTEVVVRQVGTFLVMIDFDVRRNTPLRAQLRCLEHWRTYPEEPMVDEDTGDPDEFWIDLSD